jgi:LacI family transcriptional regulator
MGLRVPDQVALAGCDGIDDIEYLECPLTTLVQPVATMCATVWQFFLNRLEQPNRKLQRTVILPELAIRQSTSPRTTAVAAVA